LYINCTAKTANTHGLIFRNYSKTKVATPFFLSLFELSILETTNWEKMKKILGRNLTVEIVFNIEKKTRSFP